jgi:hypothetical protein
MATLPCGIGAVCASIPFRCARRRRRLVAVCAFCAAFWRTWYQRASSLGSIWMRPFESKSGMPSRRDCAREPRMKRFAAITACPAFRSCFRAEVSDASPPATACSLAAICCIICERASAPTTLLVRSPRPTHPRSPSFAFAPCVSRLYIPTAHASPGFSF